MTLTPRQLRLTMLCSLLLGLLYSYKAHGGIVMAKYRASWTAQPQATGYRLCVNGSVGQKGITKTFVDFKATRGSLVQGAVEYKNKTVSAWCAAVKCP
jgi:hypothetical protein